MIKEVQERIVNTVEIVEKNIPAYVERTNVVEVEKIREKIVEVERPTVHKENTVVVQEKIK